LRRAQEKRGGCCGLGLVERGHYGGVYICWENPEKGDGIFSERGGGEKKTFKSKEGSAKGNKGFLRLKKKVRPPGRVQGLHMKQLVASGRMLPEELSKKNGVGIRKTEDHTNEATCPPSSRGEFWGKGSSWENGTNHTKSPKKLLGWGKMESPEAQQVIVTTVQRKKQMGTDQQPRPPVKRGGHLEFHEGELARSERKHGKRVAELGLSRTTNRGGRESTGRCSESETAVLSMGEEKHTKKEKLFNLQKKRATPAPVAQGFGGKLAIKKAWLEEKKQSPFAPSNCRWGRNDWKKKTRKEKKNDQKKLAGKRPNHSERKGLGKKSSSRLGGTTKDWVQRF